MLKDLKPTSSDHTMWIRKAKRRAAKLLSAAVVVSSVLPGGLTPTVADAAEPRNPQATLTVNMDPEANTGEIIYGAAGFLYGISSEDVPTTNTVVPLKSKILVTKGAVGTEHPYGDALDVAKTFLESGGEQIQMYTSNYYGVFGVTATTNQYCNDLEKYICPAVVAWKAEWKEEHGTPEEPKDAIGSRVDIDDSIVYVPINEGTPHGGNFQNSWKSYYETIKSADPEASLAGPNSAGYGWQFTEGQSFKTYIQFCADNNCMPDVITWHELETEQLEGIPKHMDDFRSIWKETDWSKYNEANGTSGTPEIPQICFNEYAEMAYCGVPGRLVNWIGKIEDEKVTGCLPFWHQANNLNDLAAGANEGNGAWWLFKWYGDMSGTTQPVETSDWYGGLYGISTMDEAKKLATTLVGGFTGDAVVQLDSLASTKTFAGQDKVHVSVQETMFTGFHGALNETPVILEGTYPVNDDGSVTITIPNAKFENAYNVTVTQAAENETAGMILSGTGGDVYEAEAAELSGTASATVAQTNPSYYMSGNGTNGNRGVDMPSGASITYTVSVPFEGKYKMDFYYGNGQGTNRNDMNTHNPVNVAQTFALDGGEAESVTMESTLFQTMTGVKTRYYDLKAGEHTITISTSDDVSVDSGLLLHDFLRVTYAGVYEEELASFNKVYEAELADVNRLMGNTDSTVSTETEIEGFSGNGYVDGLSERSVEDGGGIRNTVVVDESGLYNITLRYQSDSKGTANIYVGNTAVTLDRVNKTVSLQAGEGWKEVTASVYLQKGINVVDLDMTQGVLDYMRVRALDSQEYSTTIEAEDAIPAEMADSVKTAKSAGASGGTYVEGMEGAYENPDYLEFTYNAPAAGKYQMQVFHSNEDLAGSHTYNIKIIDKYAVVEVNGESDSPKFQLAEEENNKLYYFVDCGDHDPSTVSAGDQFGVHNSATDQLYAKDPETGYSWGLLMDEGQGEKETPGEGSMVSDPNDKAVYTNYQKALSNAAADLQDGKNKAETFIYAHNQSESGIDPRYVSYKFELDPQEYSVNVGMSNTWGNAANPKVTLSAEGIEDIAEEYSIIAGSQEKSMTVDLTDAKTNENGKVELTVKATSSDPTIQMTYITIADAQKEEQEYVSLPPYGEKALGKDALPDGIYMGELAEGIDRFIDFRNLKNETDRYFFINTFSDDTFDEKTITLDLKEGENKIRIYNDNSWNVTYGGTTGTPGITPLPNYTPNFDKFVITPMALESTVEQTASYLISVSYSDGGTAYADKNAAKAGEEYKIILTPESGLTPAHVLVNGEEMADQTVYNEENGNYVLTISDVQEDQKVQVYFAKPDSSKEDLEALYNAYKDEEQGNYRDENWEAFQKALKNAENVLNDPDAEQNEINEAYNALEDAINRLSENMDLLYFADCGDHGVNTLSEGDSFGRNNSVTDQVFGEDPETGKQWGVVDPSGDNNPAEDPKADGVYTKYTWANQNTPADCADGLPKTTTFRYARGQDGSAELDKISVDYKFELETGKTYDVEVCVGNHWGNSSDVNVYANSADEDSRTLIAENVEIASGGTKTVTAESVKTDADGFISVNVEKDKVQGSTINVNYIIIREHEEESSVILEKVEAKDPTCTEPGNAEYWKDDKGNLYADAEGKVSVTLDDVTIPAEGHSFISRAKWTETENGYSISVTFTCTKCDDTGVVTPDVSSDTKDGVTTYTATAEYEGKEFVFTKAVKESYTLTVENGTIEGADVTSSHYGYKDVVTVTANPEKDGQYFAGWYEGDTLLSTRAVYTFCIVEDKTLTAKYSDVETEEKAVISLHMSDREDIGSGAESVIMTAEWSMPSDYTMVGGGIVRSYSANTEDTLNLDKADGSTVRKNAASVLCKNGSYIFKLNMSPATAKNSVYARGYLIYEDAEGTEHTIYTDMITSPAK